MPVGRFDPKSKTAAKPEDFRRIRELAEAAPIQCGDGTVFDCDERSEKRMQEAVDYWNDIGRGSIDWRLADNTTKPMTRGQLSAYLAEIRQLRAIRGIAIYEQWRTLKNNSSTTVRDLENWLASLSV